LPSRGWRIGMYLRQEGKTCHRTDRHCTIARMPVARDKHKII